MSKILVIDDDRVVVEALREKLVKENFEVEISYSGKDAIQKLEMGDLKPDLVVLDLIMPEMRGEEVLKRLKSQASTKDIPVIILTNLPKEKKDESLNSSDIPYLVKVENSLKTVVGKIKNELSKNS